MAWHSGKPADNDFLSASVRHIRENFAELEPLHPHIAELVDLTALHPHIAELVDLTALHPHIAALLDSLIVEMGSNANGEYVRWGNGLQVCFARFDTLGAPYTTAVGPLYARNEDYNWVFPSAFASPPRVIGLTERPFDNMRSFMTLTLVSSTSVTFRPILTVQVTGAMLTVYAHLCAIGRWKQ